MGATSKGHEMNMNSNAALVYISDLMINGNWSDAQKYFKGTNVSPRDFTEWLEYQENETKLDFALLGFYCRGYQSIKDEEDIYYGN